MSGFTVACLIPPALGLAMVRAVTRAGGTPILDTASGGPDRWDLSALPINDDALVLRIRAGSEEETSIAGRSIRGLILTDWDPAALAPALERLAAPDREIWLEVRDSAEPARVDPTLPVHGWLARGSECGGITGRESAFIQTQHLARQDKPFWVQGAIGPNTAAACRLAGAAGVVLDDALALMRESALPPLTRAILGTLGAEDTTVVDPDGTDPIRVARRPDLPGAQALLTHPAESRMRLGWGDPAQWALPMGQGVGRIAATARRHGSVGRLIDAVRTTSERNIEAARAARSLAEDAPLAQALGTRFPIVQGPMTRVSDRPDFAASVAEAGALPLLALAMMDGAEVGALLDSTRARLGDHPWGVGLLGYLEEDKLGEQIAELTRVRPSFALIAGGRPDQARHLETLGISTYLHVPTPDVLRLYLEQGARRFIFEGAECGGHTGPLGGFALWEGAVDILRETNPKILETVHLLFAGGIHDGLSAAMVAALAAPLDKARIGVLMGSAYLFTQDALDNGAIVEGFQQEALACDRTTVIETGPGHRIRCAPTPFVEAFRDRDTALRAEGLSPTDRSNALDRMVAGRLRLASKAVTREGDSLVAAGPDRQRTDGLFMMGEIAALTRKVQSVSALHREVSEGALRVLGAESAPRPTAPGTPPEPIAIIGIGCILPGADDADGLWRLLLDGRSVITEIPERRWDWRLFHDPDTRNRDGIRSKWGGFIDPVPFDPVNYGIPPSALGSISLPQLLALEGTARALADAGLADPMAMESVRERTAAIFGVASAGDVEQMYKLRSGLPLVTRPSEEDLSRLPEWTEDSFPGILLNVVAGRVANRFNLGGANFTVDAACASSLTALDLAVHDLQTGRSDMALAGAVEAELSPHAYVAFSNTGALSPTGKAQVFDQDADGIVLSEGVVVLVLKRLTDADRAGDRIYATINAVAGASDGRGLGLTAPKSAGQRRSIARAQARAGITMSDLALYEAHATGTKVGDKTELDTLITALDDAATAQPEDDQTGLPSVRCVTGSTKSLLGHTRAAAGLVGVTKAALSLYHGVLPPHPGVEKPLDGLDGSSTRVAILNAPQHWTPATATRRFAGVSAFGFGGVNFHAVLAPHGEGGPLGAKRWPAELVVAAGTDRNDLLAKIQPLKAAAGRITPRAGLEGELRTLALSSVLAAGTGGPARLAITASSAVDLASKLDRAEAHLRDERTPLPPGVLVVEAPEEGGLAFLFPGQGSPYPGMGAELALYMPEMRAALDASPVRDLILPPAAFTEEGREAQRLALAATEVAQPAIAAVSLGMLALARRLGLAPDRLAGHSFGELIALHAAGAFDETILRTLAETRGRLMADLGPADGAMGMISLGAEAVAKQLNRADEVVIANINTPEQTILSGRLSKLDVVMERFKAAGVSVRRLPVSSAFHSPLMAPVSDPFAAHLAPCPIQALSGPPVHGNLDGAPYPTDPDSIRARLRGHLENRVNFVGQVEAMWNNGVRLFVELGPGRVLSGLTERVLGDRPHHIIAADGGLESWLRAVGTLWTLGKPVDLSALFTGREVVPQRLERLPAAPTDPGWRLDGGRVHRVDGPLSMGRLPFRDITTPAPIALSGMAASEDPRDQTYAAYQVTMRAFLEQQERVLTRMLGEEPSNAQGSATPDPAFREQVPADLSPGPASPAGLPDRAPVALDPASLRQRIVALVSTLTGYSEDMIDPDLDLEADLGVSSIKRIEIIGHLLNDLPEDLGNTVRESFDRLVRTKTVDKLVTVFLDSLEALPLSTGPSVKTEDGCPRFRMVAVEQVLRPEAAYPIKGHCLVTQGAAHLTERVIADLRRQGVVASVISSEHLDSPRELATRITVLRMVNGPVGAVVHLAALDPAAGEDGPDPWRAGTQRTTLGLFHLLAQLEQDIEDGDTPIRIVAAAHGRSDRMASGVARTPASGGVHGLLASLVAEYPHLLAKVVDLDPAADIAVQSRQILLETLVPGGGEEVAYAGGRRLIYKAEPAPLTRSGVENDWRIPAGGVILATGGAKGITAEACRAVAAPGVHLALVGRTAPQGDMETASTRDGLIQAFRDAGATVSYHAVDVRSPQAFGGLIQSLYDRHQRIDAVLHGAGVIEDQRFFAKQEESFQRVFSTKTDSAAILLDRLRPEGLRWVVQFGSVSGRFGNRGQADYAAANEAMTRIGEDMARRWPKTRVVTIDWGPWSGVGMASDGVQARLKAEGIETINPEEGRRFLVDELAWGGREDTEVVAGVGPWAVSTDALLSQLFAASARILRPSDETWEIVA